MPKLSWSRMMDRHPRGHLVMAIADDGEDASSLLTRLLEGMSAIRRNWAVRPTEQRGIQFAECVFADKADADQVARLFSAGVISRYPGWASQREFRLDRATETKILRALEEMQP